MSEEQMKEITCSFCDRTANQVKVLIAKDKSHESIICEHCVLECINILLEKIRGGK